LSIEGNAIYMAGGTDVPDADVADDITLTNITQITTKPITSLTSSTYKMYYSLGGAAPLELSLGADGTYVRMAGTTSAPTVEAIKAADLPTSGVDPDMFLEDPTSDDKIPAEYLNIVSMDIVAVDSIVWNAGGMVASGTCTDAAEVTINSGPIQHAIICTDAATSIIDGHVILPDGYTAASTFTFELEYIQTAADTADFNSTVQVQCRGATDTVNNTWGTPVAIADAGVTGSNAVDHTTSGAVTGNGPCAAGDTLYWKWIWNADSDTAPATLNIMGMKMEFTKTIGDE